MQRPARKFLKDIDRLMPVFALALILVFQGILASGNADAMLDPAYQGPDGRLLSAADICNTTTDAAYAGKHCGGCTQFSAAALPVLQADIGLSPVVLVRVRTAKQRPIVTRPELGARLITGPPSI